jgi:DNA-binding MarR family transcriptional regulator
MAKDGNQRATLPASSAAESLRENNARQCVAAACQQVHAGKLAARQLADWVAGRGVNEADFRLLWQLFAAAETALTSAAKAGRGAGDDAALEPAILDQATIAERLAASPASVSGTVERLCGVGLISSIAAPGADRRRQCWQLTFAGRELVLAVLASVTAVAASAPATADSAIDPHGNATRKTGRNAA